MPAITTLVFVFIISITLGDGDPGSRIVEISQGPIKGHKDPEGGFSFHGIPYATVPSGPLKFKAPLPPPKWAETFDAVDKSIICPQKSDFTKFLKVQEDCLIANVFVPDTEERNLPVIVYVHGGGFMTGYGNLVTPKNLVKSKNVIVVTFNYRLGPHGFLCLGTEDVPGNAGLKDQLAALRWINENIVNFGGNKDDVTLAGYSAGAISVDLLGISKAAENLFNKLIIESGANLMAGGVSVDPLNNAKRYATSLGFTKFDDVYALENFYENITYDTLFKEAGIEQYPLFTPCIERNTGAESILTDTPLNIIKKKTYKRVPTIYGFANMEGLFREPLFDISKDKMNEKFEDFLEIDLQFANEKEKSKVAKIIKEFYFGQELINDKNVLKYIDYSSDVMFRYPVLRTAKLHIENGHDKVYLYEYSFVDEDTPKVIHTDTRGATHCAETVAVLDGKNMYDRNETNITEDFKKVKRDMREFYDNFVRTGVPVPATGSNLPAWPPANAKLSPYMEILSPLQLRGELLPEQVRFWDDIYARHYRAPAPPPPPPKKSAL